MVSNKILKNTTPSAFAYQDKFKETYDWGFVAGSPHFEFIRTKSGGYHFSGLDNTLDWFEENKINYGIFHNLITPKVDKFPDWYINAGSQQDRRDILEDHVKTVMNHYKGRIPIYDVINHVVNNSFKKRNQDNYLMAGWTRFEATKQMLEWAREADPEAILIINEVGTDFWPENDQEYFELLKQLAATGAPLDGIGIMWHLGGKTGKLPSEEGLINALDQYASIGFPIYITEFDLSYDRIEGPFDPEEPFEDFNNYWDYQANAYSRAFEVFNNHPSVAAVFTWGMVDGTWREGEGLFDRNLEPKPAYYAVKDFLIEKKQCK